jgi:hypothetical protein
MGFKDLVGKAQELTGAAAEGVSGYLDEFNQALPTIQALGFTVQNFSVGMGLVPEVSACLVASVDDIDVDKLTELVDAHKEKRVLVAILKALQAAYNVKKQVPNIPFEGLQVDMKLGLPPHVGVQFLRTHAAGKAAAALAALA